MDRTAEIEQVMRELAQAWERQDADAFADLFTADATYVTWVGTLYVGRRDIAESHRTLWAKFLKGTALSGRTHSIRFHGDNTATVVGYGDVHKRTPKARLTKVQTYTLVREGDGRWRIAAFHNTKAKPLAEAVSFRFAPGTKPERLR
ncbi:SgcJ/EcaC family oxidoreductase [Actinokineospora sp. NPDC004072]